MNYIIDQYPDAVMQSETARKLIKSNPEELGSDYHNFPNEIKNRGEYYYNAHTGTSTKINRMKKISNELGLKLEFID